MSPPRPTHSPGHAFAQLAARVRSLEEQVSLLRAAVVAAIVVALIALGIAVTSITKVRRLEGDISAPLSAMSVEP